MKVFRKVADFVHNIVIGAQAIFMIVRYNVKNRKRMYEVVSKDGAETWYNIMVYDLFGGE